MYIEQTVREQQWQIENYIDDFHEYLEKRMGVIESKYRRDAINKMIAFYIKFLKKKKQQLISFDFYKTISWYSIILAAELRNLTKNKNTKSDSWFKVLIYAVQRMLENVKDECGREIPKNEFEKIVMMVACEIADKGNYGIGKNGLYMLMYIMTVVECPNSSMPSA